MADLTHDCPGGCGKQVARVRYACYLCWRRLPIDLRRAITGNYGRDRFGHVQAMADAQRWYRENPAVAS